MNLFGVPEQHMSNWGDALTAKNKPWATTPEYHQWGTQDLVEQKSKELSGIPYMGDMAAGAFEKVAPALALGASPIYDVGQAISRYNQDPGKYETNNKWDKVNAYFPDLEGTTTAGILNAIDQEDLLSAAYNRMIGAGKAGMESKINRQNQIQSLLGKGWDAIKNEFSGSAEAAEMPRPINRFGNTLGPVPTVIDDTGVAEVTETSPTTNWSMTDDLEAQNVTPTFETSEEQEEYLNRVRNMPTIQDEGIPAADRWRNFLSKVTRQPYRPAMGGVTMGSGQTYSPAQLNKMNALGGWYSEPARAARRSQKRKADMLARRSEGKPISPINLGRITGRDEGRGSYTATTAPAPAGVTTSSGMHGGRHYARGGIIGAF